MRPVTLVGEIFAFVRGHHAHCGVAGNLRRPVKVYRAVERYWLRMLRSWATLDLGKAPPDQHGRRYEGQGCACHMRKSQALAVL